MIRKNTAKGFTLIELSLAMVFISLLSLAIVLIIMNTISSYRKGITMNRVDSLGKELIDDIRMAIQNSSTKSVASECRSRYETVYTDENNIVKRCEDDGGRYLVSVANIKEIKIPGSNSTSKVPTFGAICTGTYSYIWNSGYTDTVENATKAELRVGGEEGSTYSNFRLLKIMDEKRQICYQQVVEYPVSGSEVVLSTVFELDDSDLGGIEPTELIDGESNLALYDLSMMAPARSDDGYSLFYSGSMILGSIEGGPNIAVKNSSCKEPEGENSNFEYCAINRFNFAARASGASE